MFYVFFRKNHLFFVENIRDICIIGIFLLILRAEKYIYIMMKLDIVLITYNQAQYIARAMESVAMKNNGVI